MSVKWFSIFTVFGQLYSSECLSLDTGVKVFSYFFFLNNRNGKNQSGVALVLLAVDYFWENKFCSG